MEISTFLFILFTLFIILTAAIMIKKTKKKPAIKNGWVFGYDPGGNGNHGVAAIKVDSGRVAECLCHTFDTAQEVVEWINKDNRPMLAIGVDTLTHWSLGKSGDRKADCWLRDEYRDPDVKKSVLTSNVLYGAMPVNGMAVLIQMREKYPRVPITETHPKVLYYALTCHKYNYEEDKDSMNQCLSEWLSLEHSPPTIKTEHEWDALISAYAALQGLKGCWTKDLAADAHDDPLTVWPCGCVHYWWPDT